MGALTAPELVAIGLTPIPKCGHKGGHGGDCLCSVSCVPFFLSSVPIFLSFVPFFLCVVPFSLSFVLFS